MRQLVPLQLCAAVCPEDHPHVPLRAIPANHSVLLCLSQYDNPV